MVRYPARGAVEEGAEDGSLADEAVTDLIHSLFGVGLTVRTAIAATPDEDIRVVLTACVDELDRCIQQVRALPIPSRRPV